LERLNRYREILNCLPQPAFLMDEKTVLLQNRAAEQAAEAFQKLPAEELTQADAVSSGCWNFRIQRLDDLRLVLAERINLPEAELAAVSAMRLPLSEALSAAGALMPTVEEQEDPILRMQAAKLNRSLYRMYRSVSNLDLLCSGVQSPRFSRVDLCMVVQGLELSVPQPCTASGVTIKTELPATPVYISCDLQLLEVALLNLLSNALRYADPKSCVAVSVAKRNGRAVLTVRNSGVPADMNDVFGDSETALMRGTAGVGLALVRKIASQMGGTFLLHTQEHETFATLAFPINLRGESELRNTVVPYEYTGGFNRVLLQLSDVLPPDVFVPEALDEI